MELCRQTTMVSISVFKLVVRQMKSICSLYREAYVWSWLSFVYNISCSTDWLVLNLKLAWKCSSKCSFRKKQPEKPHLWQLNLRPFRFVESFVVITKQLRTHPASRALLLLLGGERETLRKSFHFFEVAAVQISGLVTPVFYRQTGFYSARIIFCW